MFKGLDFVFFGKIWIVVEVIFKIWDIKKRCIIRKGKYNIDNNSFVLW